ncbi:MAG: hypothetical protein ABFS45_18430, partial [Pseudomonadota bacterium]
AVTKTLKTRSAVVRNTTKKTAKKSTGSIAKKTLRKTSVKGSPITDHEQTISKARAQLGIATAKEVSQCEKLVAKLQGQLDRAVAKQNLQREKKAAAAQRVAEKPTQAAKNQALRARELLGLVNAAIKEIRAGMTAAKTALNAAKTAQKKFIAREKQLDKFESDWIKAAKPKRKTRKRTRKVTVTEAIVPTVEEAKVEVPDSPESEQSEQTVSEISSKV